jgi:Ca2+-binding RTX toxin-like protein
MLLPIGEQYIRRIGVGLGSSSTIVNFETVQGKYGGISTGGPSTEGCLVINYGVIEGEGDGGTSAGIFCGAHETSVVNFGVIDGSNSGVGIKWAHIVRNSGTIVGEVQLDSRNDLYFGVLGDVGNVRGLQGNDGLIGGVHRESLLGNTGADVLAGLYSSDLLGGGRGNDTLIGGQGSDAFFFRAHCGSDIILDFEDDRDTIVLDSRLLASGVSTTVQSGDLTLHFGTGDDIVIQGVGTALAILDDILVA